MNGLSPFLLSSQFTFQTAVLMRLRLRSSSSHTSASWLRCGWRGEPGKRSGLFSTSLSCSSCRTSSVFSLSRSPGMMEAFAMLRQTEGWNTSWDFRLLIRIQWAAVEKKSCQSLWNLGRGHRFKRTPCVPEWGGCDAAVSWRWRWSIECHRYWSAPSHTGHFPQHCRFSCCCRTLTSAAVTTQKKIFFCVLKDTRKLFSAQFTIIYNKYQSEATKSLLNPRPDPKVTW